VLGLLEGHLIYAKGNEPAIEHSVRRTGAVIHCHAVNLAAPPAALLKQVSALAKSITASVAATQS
jgi:5-methylcytosine-specific restriction enzyme subunit McrC